MKLTVETPGRVDKLLATALPQYSRAAIAKLFSQELVLLNGTVVKPGHKVRAGAEIDADISQLDQDQQVVELPIVYEDDNVIVIDKPAGIISHARGRFWYEPSVASFIRWKMTGGSAENGVIIPNGLHTPSNLVTKSYPLAADQQGIDRMGIVHRLDRATSGLMICAKNEYTLKYLQAQFADRKVTKKYMAVLESTPEKSEAIIDAPIERNPKNPSVFRIGANGKSAQTHYVVVKTGDSGRCLVEFTPKTGRTHQLRIHAAFLKCPIVGDALYGKVDSRLFLHAAELSLDIPSIGHMDFKSTLPDDFYGVL